MPKDNRSSMDLNIRSELKRLGRRMNFTDIKVGEIYHIPAILELRRKTILVEENHNTYLKCIVEEDGRPDSFKEWIYDYELQSYFIVPYNRNLTKKKVSAKDDDNDGLPF